MKSETQKPQTAIQLEPIKVECPAAGHNNARKRVLLPGLRPPTLMIDLLFGALMLFAFQMGDPNPSSVNVMKIDIPTSSEKAKKGKRNYLPLIPHRKTDRSWVYELPSGEKMSAEKLALKTRKEEKTAVLIVPKNSRVQSYIDAEQPLKILGVQVGLAVSTKEGTIK